MIASLAFISLTTPAMLAGLGWLSLPILAHLLHRRARRPIPFPSLMLLQASAAAQSSMFKLRRRLLLLLRCLAMALIVLAFARPVWINADSAAAHSDGSIALVVLVDASASTGQQHGGVPLFQAIRAAGQRAIDALSPGQDVADIVYATAHPYASFNALALNLPDLRDELGHAQPSAQRADFPQAIALAGQLLSEHQGRRRLMILTDLQKTNWAECLTHQSMRDSLPSDTLVDIPDLGQASMANVALANPRSLPGQPIVGQPCQLAVEVTNFSPSPVSVTVTAQLDAAALPPLTVMLQPWEQQQVGFDAVIPPGGSGVPAASLPQGAMKSGGDATPTMPSGVDAASTLNPINNVVGEHAVELSIDPDNLPADNHAYLVIDAVQRAKAVVIDDDDADLPGSATYFLLRALAPRHDASDSYDEVLIASSSITPTALSRAAVVFVSDIGQLSPGASKILADYARTGGGVVFFCGAGPVPANLATLDGQGGPTGLLPWVTGLTRSDLTPSSSGLHITEGQWHSHLLRVFDPPSQFALSHVRFDRIWPVANLRNEAQVLLKFNDGTPALATRNVGRGTIVLANFSPALEAGDLGKYGSFVAMVQSIAAEVGAVAYPRSPALAGEALRYRFPTVLKLNPNDMTVIGPDNLPVMGAQIIPEPDGFEIDIDHADFPGFYQLRHAGKTIGNMAVNLDPRESDLRIIDRTELLRYFSPADAAIQHRLAPAGTLLPLSHGIPLWGWALGAAMAFMAVELILLGLWKQ